jgi:hypothetical protein
MKVHVARLSHQKDEGTTLRIEEVALRDLVLESAGDAAFGLLTWLHRDWLYAIRWGRTDPEYGFADRSLGSKLHDLTQWAGGGFGAWRRARHVARIPVSPQWVRLHFPDAGWLWDGSDEPEDSQP